MEEYQHIISLVHFCSPAQEIERIGFRECSSPFDWLISSDFEMIMVLIENNFDDFLNKEYLYQSNDNPSYYYNSICKVWFYHDFNEYEPLDEQLTIVQEKYKRRIDKFYRNIIESTLFIRYISDGNELLFIENNIKKILSGLQNFNKKNQILFILNNNLKSNKIKLYVVKPDQNDTVAREFLKKSEELCKYLNEMIYYDKYLKQKNQRRYKNKKKYLFIFKIYLKLKSKSKTIMLGSYDHYQKI